MNQPANSSASDRSEHRAEPAAKKWVLMIGLRPEAVDFSAVPGLDAATLAAGITAAQASVVAAGFAGEWCSTDAEWTSAGPTIAAALARREYAAVMIGAGIRAIPAHFLLFEQIVNLVHERAPTARLCFNTSPGTTCEAILRWVQP